MAKQIKNEKKKMNPVLWLLFAIIIPVMVVLSLLLIILNVAGVDVTGWTKDKASHVPALSGFVSEDDESSAEEEESGQLQERIVQKDVEIERLNEEITDMETIIDRLNQDILKLENRNEQNTDQSNEHAEEVGTVSSISGSFKDMDSEQAALILQNMENDIALIILQEVSNKVRGQILEVMEPEIAADLTQLLIEN